MKMISSCVIAANVEWRQAMLIHKIIAYIIAFGQKRKKSSQTGLALAVSSLSIVILPKRVSRNRSRAHFCSIELGTTNLFWNLGMEKVLNFYVDLVRDMSSYFRGGF